MKELTFEKPVMSPYGEDLWELVEGWHITFRGEDYCVNAGFVTDGASIPSWLWVICGHPMKQPRLFAALVHDYLYDGNDPEATRKDADDLYRELQIALGVSKFKAYTEWSALRMFGGSHWKGQKE